MVRTKVYGKKKGNEFGSRLILKGSPNKSKQQVSCTALGAKSDGKPARVELTVPKRAIESTPIPDDPTEALAKLTLNPNRQDKFPYLSRSKLEDETLEHVWPLLQCSGETEPTSFSEWLRKWMKLCTITKIGDGTYSNVYRLCSKTTPKDAVVGKLIPLRPKYGKGSKSAHLTPVHQALAEVRMMEALADVEGFVELRSSRVLLGKMPSELEEVSKAWDNEMREYGKIPETEAVRTYKYPNNQLWLFLEMDHAGRELEDIMKEGFEGDGREQWQKRGPKPLKVQEVRDIFYQVTRALATAEKTRHFEHRDLHISNICIKRHSTERQVEGRGPFNKPTNVEVSIIDFTISRAEIDGEITCQELPLMDDDKYNDIQLQTYVHQERAANTGSTPNDSAAFLPVTNIFWIHYLLKKLLAATKVNHGAAGEERELRKTMLALKDQTNPSLVFDGDGDILTAMELLYYLENGKAEYKRAAREETEFEANNPPLLEDKNREAMRRLKDWRFQRWKEEHKGKGSQKARRRPSLYELTT